MYVMSNRWFMLFIWCLTLFNADATQLVQGNATVATTATTCPVPPTTTFNQTINTKVYDRANGIFYVGLTDNAGDYAISAFARPIGGQIPLFKARATDASLTDAAIGGLAMAEADGNTCSLVAGFIDGQTNVFVLNTLDMVGQSANLFLFNSTLNDDGGLANSLWNIAANQCFIFAAVSSGINFGSSGNDGIAVVAINRTSLALTQVAAVPGDNGIKAQAFNNNSPELAIGNPTLPKITIESDVPSMLWDDRLQRLYLGVSLETTKAANGQGIRSVAVATVGDCPEKGTLIIRDIAPDSAFAIANQPYIIGQTTNNTTATTLVLTVTDMAMMHASTGPSYLIVHGGNGTATNQIFALPVVDLCNPTDPRQGTIANKNQFNTSTHRFEQPAMNSVDMPLATDPFTQVGAGPLPIQPDHTISDMQVIDDVVYVSLNIPQDDLNETGIFYSQAQFDTDGKIASWTPWTKRVWPICGFPDSPSNGQVAFFAVDGVTGNVIAVDGSPSQTVRITRWDDGKSCAPCPQKCSLAAVLNKTFCNGTFSVLDLDQSTNGIGQLIPFRYALFGGTNAVAFALTSSSRAPDAPFDIDSTTDIPYPQRVTLDFCCPGYFAVTELPEDAGCVRSLAYTRTDNINYFFAGTQHGLFAFAHQDGSGFDVTELDYVDRGIIASGSWQKVDAIEGAVTALQAAGDDLYIVTTNSSCARPMGSQLLRVPYADDLATMFAPGNIFTIATSGTAPVLENTLIFTDLALFPTDAGHQQLALTTNNGLFQTTAANGVENATDQTTAAWALVDKPQLYYGIGSVDNAYELTTVWPFNAADTCGCNTFEASSIYQLNSNTTDVAPTFTFIPDFFNYLITAQGCCNPADCVYCPTDCCDDEPIAKRLFEKIVYFWSDGGRRFFIVSPTNAHITSFCCNGSHACCPQTNLRHLQVTPFNTCVWNDTAPCNWALKDCILQDNTLYYWIRPIGVTGIILAGTEHGVVALE